MQKTAKISDYLTLITKSKSDKKFKIENMPPPSEPKEVTQEALRAEMIYVIEQSEKILAFAEKLNQHVAFLKTWENQIRLESGASIN